MATKKPGAVADGTTLSSNRKATHEYEILDRFEAGVVLTGTEIKSIRAGKADIGDAYIRLEHGEARMIGMHIAEWPVLPASSTSRSERAASSFIRKRSSQSAPR